MFSFPVIELVDRYCIAKLKWEKIGTNKPELDFYLQQLSNINIELIQSELNQLLDIHRRIWDMEDDFKRHRVEEKFSLEEIGRRALAIRDINAERYLIKDKICSILNESIKEVKKYG
jgi:hypothetical protein